VWGAWREETIVNQGAAAGDIIRRGASSWERLAVGANGTVLTVVAGAPAYAAGPGLVKLDTQTVTNVADVRFVTPLAPLAYDNLCITFEGVKPLVNARALLGRFSTDGGATYISSAGAYKTYCAVIGFSLSVTADRTATSFSVIDAGLIGNTGDGISGKLELFGITRGIRARGLVTAVGTSDIGGPHKWDAAIETDAARVVNGIQLFMNTGNLTGTFTLYGYVK
jgi:hypothetical protein